MPKSIDELRNATTERAAKPKKTKVILKDGRLITCAISPLTRERFPSTKRVKNARERYRAWRSKQDSTRAFNRDQYLAQELNL